MRRPDLCRTFLVWSLLLAGGLLIPAPAAGQPQPEKLADGPDADLVQAKCTLCHDIGNITRIRQSREDWSETLKVMMRRGVPLTPAEEAAILDYLTKYYGR